MLIIHGGDLAAVNTDKDSVTDIIFREIINPEKLMKELLDEQIVMRQTDKYKHYYIIGKSFKQILGSLFVFKKKIVSYISSSVSYK